MTTPVLGRRAGGVLGARSMLLIACLAVGIEILWAQTGPESVSDRIHSSLLNPEEKGVFIVAHRGDWRDYPENSLPAITSCAEMGVPIVEIDVRKTKDNQLVLMHDETVDRTTTGKGRVEDLTLEEIKASQLKSGTATPSDWKVPTLEEALVTAKGKVLLNLDKSHAYFSDILPLLEKTGTASQIIVKTKGNTPVDQILSDFAPLQGRVLLMPILDIGKKGGVELGREYIERLKPFAIEICYKKWKPEFEEIFKECTRRGIRIWINTMWPGLAGDVSDDKALSNPDEIYAPFLKLGATMIQTDRPQFLKDYLARKNALPSVNPKTSR